MPNVRLQPSGAAIPVNNVFVIGKNYIADEEARRIQHNEALVVCMKPTAAVLGAPGKIALPEFSKEVHFEIELLLLMGKEGKRIAPVDALDHVMGYGVGLDLTAFDLQQKAQTSGLPWMSCKGFDCAAPVSEFIEWHRVDDPNQIRFSLMVNGERRQSGNAADMVYSIEEIVSRLSAICTLNRGDLIFTGTPAGAGPLHSGDRLELDLMGLLQAQFEVL